MSAGIQEFDMGYVNGTTWQGLPQYVRLDRAPNYEEAARVMCFEIEKHPSYRKGKDGQWVMLDAWNLVRTDHDVTLVPHVGSRFVPANNGFLLNYLSENLLSQFPDLEIESVGTLWNGATTFLNIKVAEFQIIGDKSPQVSRLFYCNPLGKGSYTAGGHNVRIVCANTLAMANSQSAANKTLGRFRHTRCAEEKINTHMEAIAEFKMALNKHIEILSELSKVQLSGDYIDSYLDSIFPIPPVRTDENNRSFAICTNKRQELMNIFESDQDLSGGIAHSAYGLLQATTNFFDHHMSSRGGDDGSVWFDSVAGNRASLKTNAFNKLAELVGR